MAKKPEDLDFLVPWCDNYVPWQCDEYTKNYSYFDETSGSWKRDGKIDFRENKPFKAAFKVKKFTGTTSSTRIVMVNTATEAEFMIRSDDFLDALNSTACVHGVFVGEWIFRKTSGQYYGLKLYN